MNLEEHIFKSEYFSALIEEAVKFLINTPTMSLPPDSKFTGGGVYALYYIGNFSKYKNIFNKKPDLPNLCRKSCFTRMATRP